MQTFALHIATAVMNAITPSLEADGVLVELEREIPIAYQDCPACIVAIDDARAEPLGSDGAWDLLRMRTQFRLNLHSRGAPQVQRVDALMQKAHMALMADPSLGGTAQRLSFLQMRARATPTDTTAGITELLYEVTTCVDERTLALTT